MALRLDKMLTESPGLSGQSTGAGISHFLELTDVTRTILCTSLLAGLLAFSGCSKAEHTSTKEIATVRPATEDEKFAPELSTAERMRMTQAPFAQAAAAQAPVATAAQESGALPEYRWKTPEGWEEVAPTPMRQANLRLSGNPEVELYLTVMPGDGGGLLANLNRWQGQMGQPPLTQEQVDALPTQMVLNKPARLIETKGDFKGMGAAAAKPGYAMLGLALIDDGRAVFVKMTGPEAVVADQKQNFLAFAQSITSSEDDGAESHLVMRPEQAPASAEAAPPAEAAAEAAESAPAPAPEAGSAPAPEAKASASSAPPIPPADRLKWDVPAGWTEAPGSPMRLANFTIGDGIECYVSVLGGMAGGVEANINRWYGQMGKQPLSADEIASLPKVQVLGADSPYVDIEGDFTGMGTAPQPGYRLLGVVRAGDQASLFAKMTGPSEAVAAQVDAFKAFVASLR